jgi:hypothetical protein
VTARSLVRHWPLYRGSAPYTAAKGRPMLLSRGLALLSFHALALLAVAVGAAAAAEDSRFPLRWRVFCDVKTGTSFSYPYTLFPVDQYKGDLRRERAREIEGTVELVDEKGNKKLVQLVKDSAKSSAPDIHHFSFTEADLGLAADAKLSEIGDREAKGALSWSPYDYYASTATRPHGDPKWADEGIEAMLGEGGKQCALVVRHGERWSGLVLKGVVSDGDNRRIIDSFEVLSSGKKLKKGEKPDKKARLIDWRESHCKPGKVFDSTGRLIAPQGKVTAGHWPDGWDIETEHYHITTDFSPQRLLVHGLYLEALFRAYSKVYQPDDMPPYKFEVHIFTGYREFLEASAAHGNAVPTAPGSIVGGFFVTSLLSLWVYEESGALGGEDFSVEHVMAHECSHQFLHVACNGSDHVPTWINEGLAVYFESGVFQAGEFQIRPPTKRIGELKQAYAQLKSTLTPLDQYLGHHGHISASQYGEVFAMTSFWVFGTCLPDPQMCKHKNCGLRRFRDFFVALRAHEDGAKAFERIFMDDMIKARGSREKAVELWQKALMEYVQLKLK